MSAERPTFADGPADMRVSAIVVSYFTGPSLYQCLAHLAAGGVSEIIVADNGNPPAVSEDLRRRAAQGALRLVSGQGNVGFSRACNLAAAAAAGEALAFVNPDALVEPDCIAALVSALEGAAAPAIIGGRLAGPDGIEQRGARRDVIEPWNALVAAFGLGRFEAWSPRFRSPHRERDPTPETPLRVGAVSGALMVMRRADFTALAGFDEEYFLHVEDLDICRRAAIAGGDVLFQPAARALHYRSTSTMSRLRVERWKAASFKRYFHKFARNAAERRAAFAVSALLGGLFVGRGLLMEALRWAGQRRAGMAAGVSAAGSTRTDTSSRPET